VKSTILLGAAMVVLAGCALEHKPELALACQTQPCTCLPAEGGFLAKPAVEPVPVQWRANGDAYCDAGYVLSPIEEKKKR